MEREQHDGRDVVLERVKQSQSLRQLRPEIFNRDQGCQFTKAEWTSTLASWGGRIGMDGRGQWMDHVFIERLWRSLKYENLYMHKYRDVTLLEAGIGKWLHNYNVWRPHAALENNTQISMYCPQVPTKRRIKQEEDKPHEQQVKNRKGIFHRCGWFLRSGCACCYAAALQNQPQRPALTKPSPNDNPSTPRTVRTIA